jgi:hypothetical protein
MTALGKNFQENTMAILKITRSNEHTNRLRDIKLFLNDKELGSVANGALKEFTVGAGRYSLFAKIDWCSSDKVDFEVESDDTITFDLMSFAKGSFPNGFSALYYMILKPGRYLVLKKVDH